jgi:DNA-binding Xre family transcriptional regulator
LAKLAKQEPVTLETLEKICNVLDCNIGDVVEFIKEND